MKITKKERKEEETTNEWIGALFSLSKKLLLTLNSRRHAEVTNY
jgi:hypothetical protein